VGLTNTPDQATDPAGQGTPTSADGDVEVQPLFPTAESEEEQEPAGEIIVILGDDMPDPAWNIEPVTSP
jgi:hypothetical protein